ncbi:E3 ubiquitin-protein ligase FANCL [Bagarius yarrelli]|uniref:E3 ubiquitin-protein ligase FANCL n=1 Tax=Bagarius yarrelli TaxID=175774 RepID=A0A556TMX9_BAGYA|nr:E3 ubiquitin-protein ligase FANCL [Bagarius yarrelli]
MAKSLLKECPLLVALDKKETIYDGFISVQEVALKRQPSWQSIPPPQYYSQLITEIETLGWDKLIFIDTDFHTVKLRAEDSSHRQHVLTVRIKSKYPAEAPECSADLPVPLVIPWSPQQIAMLNLPLLTLTAQSEVWPTTISYQSAAMIYELPSLNCNFCLTAEQAPQDREPLSNLAHMHSQFLLIVEALAEFWAVMDEIDEHTWVLEPEKPSRADTMRRIAIGNNVSIKVEIDPKHPKMLPECCLLGAEYGGMFVTVGSARLYRGISKRKERLVSFSVECGICYSYRLDSAIPDQVCNDPRCGQPFHQACLYEWLRGLPTSRQSFNTVFGECPYCSKVLMAEYLNIITYNTVFKANLII